MISSEWYGELEPFIMNFLSKTYDSSSFQVMDKTDFYPARIVEQQRFNKGPVPSLLRRVMAMEESFGLMMREGGKPVGYVVGMDLESYNKMMGHKPEPSDRFKFFVYDLAVVADASDLQAPLFQCDALLGKFERILRIPHLADGEGSWERYDAVVLVLPDHQTNHGLFQSLTDAGYSKTELNHSKGPKSFKFDFSLDVYDAEDGDAKDAEL